MKMKSAFIIFLCSFYLFCFAQKKTTQHSKDSIVPVGITKNISDSTLLDIVQRQTFRFFWHYAHSVSGLARERDNTVHAQYY